LRPRELDFTDDRLALVLHRLSHPAAWIPPPFQATMRAQKTVCSSLGTARRLSTERLLKVFDDVTLTIVHLSGQIIRHVTPLTALQIRILERLGLSPGVYPQLAEN
jgi:hypothetical protein